MSGVPAARWRAAPATALQVASTVGAPNGSARQGRLHKHPPPLPLQGQALTLPSRRPRWYVLTTTPPAESVRRSVTTSGTPASGGGGGGGGAAACGTPYAAGRGAACKGALYIRGAAAVEASMAKIQPPHALPRPQ